MTMRRTLLVTGGAGFMGSAFIRHILAARPETHVVNFDKLTYAGNLENLASVTDDPRYAFVRGDIADAAAVEKTLTEHHPEAIINYAAETHVDRSILAPEAFIRTDVLGTYVLLEAAKRHQVERYVQISTDEVYGAVAEGETDESASLEPRSPYAASKAGGDHLVQAYFTTYGIPTILTRACNNYGPYQYPEKLIPLFITNLVTGGKVPVYGDGKQIREWLYVDDHAAAIATVLERGKPGQIYNIGSGERLENIDVTQQLLEAFEKSEELIDYIADRAGHDRRYAPNSEKIRSELGWQPKVRFREGLAKTIAWYCGNEAWWKKLKSGEYLAYYKQQYEERR